jgi:thiamine biosynthesis lipoprotein
MGTRVEITALGQDRAVLESAVEAAFAEIGRVEGLMSNYREGAEVWRINAGAGRDPVVVDPEVFGLIEVSTIISIRSQGAFDVTVGALKGAWSFNPDHPRRATAEELAARLPLIGWEKIILDPIGPAVGLLRPGMGIDLGGIAKGYAADQAMAVLKSRGVTMALVALSGDILAMGRHGDRPWEVGIQDPRRQDAVLGTLPLADSAISTSGDYEKYFMQDGKRFSHLLNPQTGRPADQCQSVTVIAPVGWLADAMATAIFVLGPEQGMALAQSTPGISVFIIAADGRRRASPGFSSQVEWMQPAQVEP